MVYQTPQTLSELQPVWQRSYRADPIARVIADRHYNRQKPGSPQFVPPGRCVVLVIPEHAVWVTSWPYAQYVRHAWAGAWINSCFRKESCSHPRDYVACDHDGGLRPCGCCWLCGLVVSPVLASAMIREAVAATRAIWPDIPQLGMVTFVNPSKVRHKRDVGRCYLRAGFKYAGYTKGGLVALQLLPCDMPDPVPPKLGVTRQSA